MNNQDDDNAKEVEVEIVDENGNSTSSNKSANDNNYSGGIKPWIPLIVAIAYTIFPIDIIPDTIPVLGHFEDILFIVIGALNGVEKTTFANNKTLVKILKFVKWGLIGAGLIAIVIIVLLVVVVVKTVSN